MKEFSELTDDEWMLVAALLPEFNRRLHPYAGGYSLRAVFNAVLWVLYTDSAWKSIPSSYAPHGICRGRFSRWCVSGAMQRITVVLAGSRPDLPSLVRTRDRKFGRSTGE